MRFALKSFAFGAVAALVAATAFAQTVNTYTNSTPAAIPDTSTMTSTISVPAGDWGGRDTVRDVNVSINLFHTWDSDINVSLTGPDGTVIALWAGVGGSADGFNVTIDDEAAGNINDINGTFRPQNFPREALCKLDALDPSGTYTLTIADTVGGDSGTLNSWSITVEGDSGHFRSECESGDTTKGGRGLGSHANNGRGNGDDLLPPGQHGNHGSHGN